MKTKDESIYDKNIKRMSKWMLSIIILSIFSFVLPLQLEKKYEILFICIGFLLEIILFPFFFKDLIIYSINIGNDKRILSAFCINLLFMHHSSIFIISDKYNNNIIFQLVTIIALIIIIIRICKIIEIDENSSFSIIKSMNLFFAAGISMIIYIVKLNNNIFKLENWINFYYLLPFLTTQGMYELLDGRIKQRIKN
jgi:hypothetical protein